METKQEKNINSSKMKIVTYQPEKQWLEMKWEFEVLKISKHLKHKKSHTNYFHFIVALLLENLKFKCISDFLKDRVSTQ